MGVHPPPNGGPRPYCLFLFSRFLCVSRFLADSRQLCSFCFPISFVSHVSPHILYFFAHSLALNPKEVCFPILFPAFYLNPKFPRPMCSFSSPCTFRLSSWPNPRGKTFAPPLKYFFVFVSLRPNPKAKKSSLCAPGRSCPG